ncbi:apoptosis facilitator Bcl-2-like protein 14 [Pungitius pungitius]|uniref:apoptosis facilitator Bcl-2-like protein 14 n=1 Tax=Pungitius pungitius TaxID=134920 RepID=UPI002E15AA67
MANGQVEIHDPFAEPVSSPDRGPEPPSDSDSMEPTVEFRVLMAYAKRRRPQKAAPSEEAEAPSAHTPDQTETDEQQQPTRRRKKKKMRMKRWTRSIFSCIKPQTEDQAQSRGSSHPDVHDRCAPPKGAAEVDEVEDEELNEVAERLTKMADEIPFVRPDLETDSVEDETVEKLIGVLLRDTGDKLNEAELKDLTIKLSWDYGLFKLLMSTFLTRMGLRSPHPDSPGPKASPKTQIAVACEVTSRLVGFNPLPRNRLLDHGARYLQHYYSPWAQQHGGYEEAFYSDDEDDSQ